MTFKRSERSERYDEGLYFKTDGQTFALLLQRGIAKSGSSDRRCCTMAPNGWIDFKLSMEGSFGR